MKFTHTTTFAGSVVSYGQAPKNNDWMGVITRIAQEVEDLSRKTIQDWIQARDAAMDIDNPTWQPLQDLFKSLSTDGHYKSQKALRIGAVVGKRLVVRSTEDEKEDKAKSKMLRKEWVLDLMTEMMESVFLKYTVLQIPDIDKIPTMHPAADKFFLIPRRNFLPQYNKIRLDLTRNDVIDITDPGWNNTILCMKSRDEFGLINDIIPDLVFKRNARQGWAIFAERFGIPLVSIETNRTKKEDIDKIEAMAAKLGQAARAVLPVGSKVDIHDSATKGDPFNVWLKQIEYCDDLISRAILGGNMISSDGASRAQGEVHERQLDDKITVLDLLRMEYFLNDQLLPLLIRSKSWNFTEKDEITFDLTEHVSLKSLWDICKGAMEAGYDINEDWLRKKFSIDITGKRKPALNTKGAPPEDPEEDFNKPPKEKKPTALGGAMRWPDYTSSGCCPDCGKLKPTAAGRDERFLKILDDAQEEIMQKLFEGKDVFADYMKKGVAVGGAYRDGMFEGWGDRRLQIAYDTPDHRALAAMEMNLFTFSGLREKASVAELNKLLVDKDGKRVRSFEEFKQLAKPHLANMNGNWLETEYNFAIAAGQGASRYQQFLAEADTITHILEYMTVGDKNVRPKHQLLEGRKFSIYDPEARRIWPPNDWNCRCEFIQYIGEVSEDTLTTGKKGIELLEWTDKQKKYFGVNRGDIGQVFLDNQMYMTDAGFGKDVKAMTYDKYGRKPWSELKDNLKALSIDNSINSNNVAELFKEYENTGYMGFKDHLDRAVTLTKKVFDEHTQSTRYTTGDERRDKLFPHVADVLANPDELYMQEYRDGAYQMKYLKFYNDTVLVVPVRLGKKNLEITTWYELRGKEAAQRNGLLIHTK